MDIKNKLLDTIQEYSYKLYKAGMRQAAGDYAFFVAWVRSENWDNPLKGGKKRLPPEPLGINTVDPYSNNCPIPYEKIVPINDYCRIIIDNIIELLESLKSIIDDDSVINVIENFIEASGKTEYSYNAVPLIFDRPDVDYPIHAGGSLVLHYNYKNTNYNVAGHLLGKYGKLNAAILRAEDVAGNEVNTSDLSLSVNGAEVSLVNNGNDSITLNRVYVAYGEWSYGVTGYNYTFSDSLENLNSNSLSALRLAPPSNLTYFDTDFLSLYKTIVGVNEVDCEEYQDYIWGKRVGLTVALYGTRVNIKNTSTHNIENIHGIRFKNWFPETVTIKTKVKFTPENDGFDFNNVAYLDLSKDLTDITVDGIFVYDLNSNKIKYDISKVYRITNVFGGTFEYDDPGVSLFNKDGFIGIKKDSVFATDLAIHIKYSTADKPPAYCTNCGSKLDLYDVCHNTECPDSPDYIERCSECNSVLVDHICHNTDCTLSPDYIEHCSECNSVLVNHVCRNSECPNSPDYVEYCSKCGSVLVNHICHNTECINSPDYIEYCPECNSILVDHICHNTECVLSPDYIENEDPVVGGELSLTEDTSLTKVFRAPLVVSELNLVESLNILSLDEDEVI